LKTKLLSEKDKQSNAAFKDELTELVTGFNDRFGAYLNDDFLLLATLLDPRYTLHTAFFLQTPFHEFVPKIIEFAEKLTPDEEESQSELTNDTGTQSSTAIDQDSFWSSFPSLSSENGSIEKASLKDVLEVSSIIFVCFKLFNFCSST